MLVCVTRLRGIPNIMGGVETHCEELLPRIADLAPEVEIEVLAQQPMWHLRSWCFAGSQ
jgi:hypothetical protein